MRRLLRRRTTPEVAALLPDGPTERDQAFLDAETQRYRAGAFARNFATSPANQTQPAPWHQNGDPA